SVPGDQTRYLHYLWILWIAAGGRSAVFTIVHSAARSSKTHYENASARKTPIGHLTFRTSYSPLRPPNGFGAQPRAARESPCSKPEPRVGARRSQRRVVRQRCAHLFARRLLVHSPGLMAQ